MSDFKVLVPEGYEVVETDQVVSSDTIVYTYFFREYAERQAKRLNEARIGPLLRYVTEPTSKGWRRWAVVPYQNVLRKIE